ncbi:hypothetical protein [Mycolicibacterium sp.]|uniref:hypothetical protein n=1 Tax=Mycolicibacterium sp. TaxID=2320850 RepID=UPI0037C9D960
MHRITDDGHKIPLTPEQRAAANPRGIGSAVDVPPLTPEQRDALRYWHRLAAEVQRAREDRENRSEGAKP